MWASVLPHLPDGNSSVRAKPGQKLPRESMPDTGRLPVPNPRRHRRWSRADCDL